MPLFRRSLPSFCACTRACGVGGRLGEGSQPCGFTGGQTRRRAGRRRRTFGLDLRRTLRPATYVVPRLRCEWPCDHRPRRRAGRALQCGSMAVRSSAPRSALDLTQARKVAWVPARPMSGEQAKRSRP